MNDQSSDSDTSVLSTSDSEEVFTSDIERVSMAEIRTYHLHRFNGQNYQLWPLETLLNARITESESQTSEAYYMKGKKHHNKHGSNSSRENVQNKDQPTRRPGKCNHCGIPGHWARECRKKQRENKQSLVAHASQKQPSSSAVQTADSAQLLTIDNLRRCNVETEDAWFAQAHPSICRFVKSGSKILYHTLRKFFQ